MQGINEKTPADSSEGIAMIPFKIQDINFDIKFHIIDFEHFHLPYDGLIGGALLKAIQAKIDYANQLIELTAIGKTIPFFYEAELLKIPPNTRAILQIKTMSENKCGTLENLPFPACIQVADAIYQQDENKNIIIPVSNCSNEEALITLPAQKLEPIEQILQVTIEKVTTNRKKLLEENLRLQHLTNEESKKLK
ncbi:unnamed protein product, partial [Brugia timori]|uniref:BFN domain-containing protein n=1 Tax=Brugia timori TaxID=42155 RepID=A0A0R3QIR6_9BILA